MNGARKSVDLLCFVTMTSFKGFASDLGCNTEVWPFNYTSTTLGFGNVEVTKIGSEFCTSSVETDGKMVPLTTIPRSSDSTTTILGYGRVEVE